MRRAAAALALLSALAAPARAATVDTPGCVLAPAPKLGLDEVGRKRVSARVLELTLRSAAMGGEQKAWESDTPGGRYTVGAQTAAADDAGRLRFTLDLGPSHRTQQDAFGDGDGDGDRRAWRRVTARIRPA
jgi:hypothetical protein